MALILFFGVNAQQDVLTTQFWNNYTHFNPAYSGLEKDHSAAVTFRKQWYTVNGAPTTLMANYSTLLSHHHGLGVNYAYDAIGFNTSHQLNINYNYQFVLGRRNGSLQKLSVGISVGFINLNSSPEWVPPTTLNDQSLPTAFDFTDPNFNAGVAYKGRNLTTGIGITHLIPEAFRTVNSSLYTVARHYYAMGSYSFIIGNRGQFELKPQVIIRTDAVMASSDINLLATLERKYWFGITYRTQDAVAVMVGWDIKGRYRIGYSYDHTMSKLSNGSTGSHEIVLGFNMNNNPTAKRKPCKCKKHDLFNDSL